MSNPTKPTTNLTREELCNWLVEHTQLIEETGGATWRELEVDTFIHHLDTLIKTHTQAKEREARIDENKRWLTILAPSMDENVAYNSDFHDRINQLTKENL